MIQLTDIQRQAVLHTDTPALVVAGAGSGKTRTLTAKIAHLISLGFKPESILAITFTNKAAEEMKTRLVKLTGLPLKSFPWVRTYHSACFRILKIHCNLLGFSQPLQIFSPYQQKKILTEIFINLNYDKKNLQTAAANISMAKNSGNHVKYFDEKTNLFQINIYEIYKEYEKALFNANAVDFDNILMFVRNILRDNQDLRKQYKQKFKYILVDEYQDSNNIQDELTKQFLDKGNLFCVGDDWQSVYGFRGSNINNFINFKNNYPDAKIFRLEENFRSADEIIKVANDLIENNFNKISKECFSKKKGGIISEHRFPDETSEANWIVKKINSLSDAKINLNKIAVLYRTKACSYAFEKAFRTHGISYKMLGSKGFFERKEIMDITCYLIAAVYPNDNVAFERIINLPKRGIGPKMLNKISSMMEKGVSLSDAARQTILKKIMSEKIHRALKTLMGALDKIKLLSPDMAIKEVLYQLKYLDYLKKYSKTDAEFISRKENIDELIYTASKKKDIIEFLEEASLVKEDKKDDNEENSEAVNLSTIHASKGLEFTAVFVTCCEEQLFPHWKSLNSKEELEEERRLMYVAITRAEHYLYLTSSSFRRNQSSRKSRFIFEMLI